MIGALHSPVCERAPDCDEPEDLQRSFGKLGSMRTYPEPRHQLDPERQQVACIVPDLDGVKRYGSASHRNGATPHETPAVAGPSLPHTNERPARHALVYLARHPIASSNRLPTTLSVCVSPPCTRSSSLLRPRLRSPTPWRTEPPCGTSSIGRKRAWAAVQFNGAFPPSGHAAVGLLAPHPRGRMAEKPSYVRQPGEDPRGSSECRSQPSQTRPWRFRKFCPVFSGNFVRLGMRRIERGVKVARAHGGAVEDEETPALEGAVDDGLGEIVIVEDIAPPGQG